MSPISREAIVLNQQFSSRQRTSFGLQRAASSSQQCARSFRLRACTLLLGALCMALAACSTTKISSHKNENLKDPYNRFAVFFLEGDFSKRKFVEDQAVSSIQEAGATAIQGYKVISPVKSQSTEESVDALLKTNADALLVIKRRGEQSNLFNLQGTESRTAIDSKGTMYTYQAPTTESYTSSSRSFRTELIDMRKQEVVWFAESESKTLTPTELRLFSDFYESSVNNFMSKLLKKMQEDGLITKN